MKKRRMMKVSQDIQVVHFTTLTWDAESFRTRDDDSFNTYSDRIKLKPIPPPFLI